RRLGRPGRCGRHEHLSCDPERGAVGDRDRRCSRDCRWNDRLSDRAAAGPPDGVARYSLHEIVILRMNGASERASNVRKEVIMTGRKWIGIATALATVGLAAPAFAQEYYPDDHQMFHQDQREEHALQHEELDAQHQTEHMREAQDHARMHAEGWGDDPFSHW